MVHSSMQLACQIPHNLFEKIVNNLYVDESLFIDWTLNDDTFYSSVL